MSGSDGRSNAVSDLLASGSVAATSVSIPALSPHHVPRPALYAMLDARRAITTVIGAAGFGKTTLVSGWAAQRGAGANTAWLALDGAEDDALSFVGRLLASLQAVDGDAVHNANLMFDAACRGAHPASGPDAILNALLNELSAGGDAWTIVLEDYPVGAANIDGMVIQAIERLPPNVDVIVIARGEPAFPLARWRVRGRLTEVGTDELRFGPRDTKAFLNEAMALHLDDDELTLLDARAEGWVAGLQLAAVWIASRRLRNDDPDVAILAFDGQHRFVADYLATEILAVQEPEIRRFLLMTSALDHFDAEMCDALVDRTGSGEILLSLRAQGLFLVALDNRGRRYRYHHLFRDFLRAQADPADLIAVHRRASVWFERTKRPGDAIRHAVLAKDEARAIDLIKAAADPALAQGQFVELFEWLALLPDETVRADAVLSGYKAWLLYLRGRRAEAELYSALVARPEGKRGAEENSVLLAFRAFLHINRGQIAETEAEASRALAQEGDGQPFFDALLLLLLGSAQRLQGKRNEAIATLRRTIGLAEKADNVTVRLEAISELVPLIYAAGALREAVKLCESGIGSGDSAPVAGLLHVRLGQLLYEMNDLTRSQATLERGLELCELLGHVDYICLGKRHLARCLFAQGARGEARELLADAARLAGGSERARQRRAVDAVSADLLLRDNHVLAAANLIGIEADHPDDGTDLERMVRLRIYLAQDRPRRVESALVPMASAAERENRVDALIAIEGLQALAAQARFDETAADGFALSAIERALPLGYVRTLLDLGPQFGEIVDRLAARSAGARELIAIQQQSQSREQAQPDANLLTAAEADILHLIARGMSNRDIASCRSVTLGTVKWHVHHICQKLDVTNRTEAVFVGRGMNLIAD